MGKDLRGKEIGDGIYQQPNGTYVLRHTFATRCIESHIKLNVKWHSVALDVALGQISKSQKPRKFKEI